MKMQASIDPTDESIRMKFRSVMVAVDFSRGGELTAPSQTAVQEALFWAERWKASVRFVHFADVSERTWEQMQSDKESAPGHFFSAVQLTLENLVASTRETGLQASFLFGKGKAWLELIRSLPDEGDEFIFAGAASAGALARAIFGGTTRKLVRKCPVPVWVVKEESTQAEGCVLAPHDMAETGERVLQHSSLIAAELEAPLKIIHALHLPEFTQFMSVIPSSKLAEEKRRVRATIEQQLKLLEYQGDYEIILEIGPPAPVIHRYLRDHPVRLLVMGSVGRSGIPGLVVGNTAETILPWVSCSMLILKPEGFVSPVAAGH